MTPPSVNDPQGNDSNDSKVDAILHKKIGNKFAKRII
jgi:hypothetical protein